MAVDHETWTWPVAGAPLPASLPLPLPASLPLPALPPPQQHRPPLVEADEQPSMKTKARTRNKEAGFMKPFR